MRTDRRKVPESRAEVSWSHFRLHDRLVPALAEGRADGRRGPLPVAVRRRLRGGSEVTTRAVYGNDPRRHRAELFRLLPEVRSAFTVAGATS